MAVPLAHKSAEWIIKWNKDLFGGDILRSKRYGRLSLSAWLSLEMERSSPAVMLLLGGLLLVICIAVRLACGNPYEMLHILQAEALLPPIWILNLFRAISCFLAGAAAGFALAYRAPGKKEEKYKGSTLFLLMTVLEMVWYPTLFFGGFVLLGALERILILFLALSVISCFYRVCKFAGVLLALHTVWLFYLLILNLAILLH